MRYLVMLACSLSVLACTPVVPLVVISTTPESARKPQPASDVVDDEAVSPREGAGVIVVTRPKVWVGKRCTYDIALDDQHVAGLRPGEQVTIYSDPGTRVLAVSIRDQGGCETANAQVPLDVVSHTTSRIEVDSDSYYDLKIEVNAHGGALPR